MPACRVGVVVDPVVEGESGPGPCSRRCPASYARSPTGRPRRRWAPNSPTPALVVGSALRGDRGPQRRRGRAAVLPHPAAGPVDWRDERQRRRMVGEMRLRALMAEARTPSPSNWTRCSAPHGTRPWSRTGRRRYRRGHLAQPRWASGSGHSGKSALGCAEIDNKARSTRTYAPVCPFGQRMCSAAGTADTRTGNAHTNPRRRRR